MYASSDRCPIDPVVACASVGCSGHAANNHNPSPAPSRKGPPLGEKEIPGSAYYGLQTARALENFQLSGILINHYPGFVEAWAMVKLAAAQANTDVGAMKPERLAAIQKAADEVLAGKYHDQFLVDWYQGGAGTSTNMNASEVLANVGLEATGRSKGQSSSLSRMIESSPINDATVPLLADGLNRMGHSPKNGFMSKVGYYNDVSL